MSNPTTNTSCRPCLLLLLLIHELTFGAACFHSVSLAVLPRSPQQRRPHTWRQVITAAVATGQLGTTDQEHPSAAAAAAGNAGFIAVEGISNDSSIANNDEVNNNPAFSQPKWKKKRYMMMKDIDDLVQQEDPRAPHKAKDLVHRMQRLYEKTGIVNYKPTVQVYNLWINAIAKCSTVNISQDNRGQEAEAVLDLMKQDGLVPSVVTFTSIMDAYARSNQPNAAQEAERVLFDYLHLEQQIQPLQNSKLSSITCDAVLNAWAQRGTHEAAERAQLLLERFEQFQNQDLRPTAHSYASVIHAWALCGQAEKAEAILDRLLVLQQQQQQQQQQQPRKSKRSIATTMTKTQLDTVVCNAVLHAWATSGDAQAGTRALQLFHRMEQWANDKGYDTQPDIVTYNTLLSAWSHSGHMKAAPQAEKILQDLIQAHQKDPASAPSPNTVSYNSVLHAWSRSTLPGAPQRAQNVLEYMIRTSLHGNRTDISPDVYSFTSVLNAWAKSKEPNKATRARDLLQTMLEMYEASHRPELQPTQVPFNAVLNACAFSALTSETERREALQVAVSTFSTLRRHCTGGPDTVSYGNLLKCMANLMPLGTKVRHDMALQTFRQCCDDGLVGEMVWTEIQRAVPAKLLRTELDGAVPGSPFRSLPRAWKKNVLRTQNKKEAAEQRQQQERKTKESSAGDSKSESSSLPIKRLHSITESSYSSRDV